MYSFVMLLSSATTGLFATPTASICFIVPSMLCSGALRPSSYLERLFICAILPFDAALATHTCLGLRVIGSLPVLVHSG